MFDSPMGYHQLAVSPESHKKLAIQGVNAIKWTYTVMPFRPTNGPAFFITFIHDVDGIWKELAKQNGLPINNATITRIIVHGIISWAESATRALAYMRCQLKVCQAYNLSLNLFKSHYFLPCFKFVGIDLCLDGNHLAKSKH
jgi:hypothetical protein